MVKTKSTITISDKHEASFKIALGRIGGVLEANGINAKDSITKVEKENGLNIGTFTFEATRQVAIDVAEAAACLGTQEVLINITVIP